MSKIEELNRTIEDLRERHSDLLQRITERERTLEESREAVLAGEDTAVATATASRTEVEALREAAEDVEKRLRQAEQERAQARRQARREELRKELKAAKKAAAVREKQWLDRFEALSQRIGEGLEDLRAIEAEWEVECKRYGEAAEALGTKEQPPRGVRNFKVWEQFKDWKIPAEQRGWPRPPHAELVFDAYKNQKSQ